MYQIFPVDKIKKPDILRLFLSFKTDRKYLV